MSRFSEPELDMFLKIQEQLRILKAQILIARENERRLGRPEAQINLETERYLYSLYRVLKVLDPKETLTRRLMKEIRE